MIKLDPPSIIIALFGRDRAWRIARAIYMRARGEKMTNAITQNGEAILIARTLRRGNLLCPVVFMDVGANLGEWTETALGESRAVGLPIKIHVFEPTPKAADRLERVFADQPTAIVHRIALSNRTGTAKLRIFGDTAGTNSLETDPQTTPAATIEVETLTGADFSTSRGLDTIDLVKIDTEGHDFNVLSGFEAFLARRAIGAIQFEYNSRWLFARRSMRDVFDMASRTGYRLGRIARHGIEMFDQWNPECDRFFEDNFALVRPDLIESLGGIEMRWSASNTLELAD